ncbi:MAG: sugar ABC transporter substrate-binding protein [Spirochaetales bacterium]|nr:sugar ABC transporter substrate-binding protein [Spirochaetales bacterium]
MLKRLALLGLCFVFMASFVFAGGNQEAPVSEGPSPLSLWYHGAGNEVERSILLDVINGFNSSQSDYVIVLEEFPQESYNDSVTAAALSGDLPDIIDVDGPIMPNWAWSGYMAPLGLSENSLKDFLPGAIGEWDGEVYSVGLWDAACAVYARKSVLDKYGIRIPSLSNPWTLNEFNSILEKLDASGEFEYAFDPGMAWTGEWYPYAFSPFLQSFGGDMIDRSDYSTAEGFLNGEAAVAFGQWWQDLFTKGYAPGTSQDPADRDTGFIEGRYALQWNGNWAAPGVLDAVGDDLLFLPAPDFGKGPKIGAASWQFGIAKTSEKKDGARAFIQYAIQDNYLTAFSDGIGNIPATSAATRESKYYSPGAPMEVFFELSTQQALIRPPTPGYVVMAKVFEKTLADISNGAEVQDALDAAVDEINLDIENNNGYGF